MLANRSTTTATATTAAEPAPAMAPGKQPLGAPPVDPTAAAPPIAAGTLPPALASHAGETFLDGGHYVWRIDPDGSFVCVAQPASAPKNSVNARVRATTSPELWQALCALATEQLSPAAEPAPPAVEPPATAPAAPGTKAPTTAPAPSGTGGFSLEGFLALLGFNSFPDIGSLVSDLVELVTGPAGDPAASQPAPAPAAPAPSQPAPAQPAPAQPAPAQPAPAQPAPAQPAPAQPAPAPAPAAPTGPETGGEATMPAVVGDIRLCISPDARLRDDKGIELAPRAVVPVSAYVRVLERKVASKPMVRVEQLASPNAANGSELGWTNESNVRALSRPPRPSNPAAQMAALVAAANAGKLPKAKGGCYHFVKEYIIAAGGYGDILNIWEDERFAGHLVPAVGFAAAVEAAGAATLGLEAVSGLPADAPVGTILVMRANGKITMDPVNGDISVITGRDGDQVICVNDATMPVPADPAQWAGGAHFSDTIVGMWKPIARP